MKNNKKSISTKIKAFVLGAIIVGVVAVTTVVSLTGCNTNTPNNPPTLSQPGDFDDNQNNNNQTNNNENNQTNNNETNNNQNNNQTQQKTEAQKLKEAFDAFNIAVKEKVAAKEKITPDSVEINYVDIVDGVLVVNCTYDEIFTNDFTFKNFTLSGLNNLTSVVEKINEAGKYDVVRSNAGKIQGCESDVEDALRDAGYIKRSDKVLSLSCSDVANAGAMENGKMIYYSNINLVVLNASGKAQMTKIEMSYAGTDLFENIDRTEFRILQNEQLNSDVVAKYYEMQNGIFNADN